MQQRNEIVGYRAPLNQTIAHFKTGLPVAISTMRACRSIFGWLTDPSFDFMLGSVGLVSAAFFLAHVKNNFGAERLQKLQRDAIQVELMVHRLGFGPRLSERKMCLFRSPEQVYKRHRDTVEGSVFLGAITSKVLDSLIREGLTISNLPCIGLAIFLFLYLLSEFQKAEEELYDATLVSADRVLLL